MTNVKFNVRSSGKFCTSPSTDVYLHHTSSMMINLHLFSVLIKILDKSSISQGRPILLMSQRVNSSTNSEECTLVDPHDLQIIHKNKIIPTYLFNIKTC